MKFRLVRAARDPDHGTFGVLSVDGRPLAVTLEPAPAVIPAGTWPCRRTTFWRGGYETFEVLVPGHSRLLFHRGNSAADTEGCVLVASSFDWPDVVRSTVAHSELMRVAAGVDSAELEVVESFG